MKILQTLARRVSSFRAAKAGVSAVEFALILPVMLLLYSGSVELSEALAVDRKANRVSSTICDLVSQETDVTSAEMQNIFDASSAIMEPYPSGSVLKMELIVVDIGTSSQTVAWSRARQGGTTTTPFAKGAASPVTVPTSIAVTGTQVVVARITYSFTPAFSFYMQSLYKTKNYDLQHIFMMRPRLGTAITFT